MPHALLRAAALAAALLASQAAAAGAASVDGRADPRGGTATAAATPATAALTLINGDCVLAGSAAGGPRTAAVLRGPGSSLATSLLTVRLNTRRFLIPWAALPYLGRGLDPRLFDVGALQYAEQDGRLPVTVRYYGQLPTLPGVTVTRSAAGTAQGYLTAASASLFGAALARQMVADHSSGSYGSEGLFADGVSISLPGMAPAPIRPRFPMHTLTVTGTNLAGGTQLARASNARGWAEQVWDQPGSAAAGGSGCSAYVAKPAWQHDPHCPGRTVADAAALAWNIPIYDSSLQRFGGPWVRVGGTSASAPLIAGIYGLAGNAAHISPGYPYRHPTHLFDITTGNNVLSAAPAAACGNDYLCAAKKGYDAPTGLGTPNGTGSF